MVAYRRTDWTHDVGTQMSDEKLISADDGMDEVLGMGETEAGPVETVPPEGADEPQSDSPVDEETMDSLVDTLFFEAQVESAADQILAEEDAEEAEGTHDGPLPYDDGFNDEAEMLVEMSHATAIIDGGTQDPLQGEAAPEETPLRQDAPPVEVTQRPIRVLPLLACLLVGTALGVMLSVVVSSMPKSGGTGEEGGDAPTLSEGVVDADGLDAEMVRYEHGGQSVSLSVRDVIELTGSLDSMADGASYRIPSAEKALEAVRNDLVLAEAARQGIDVSDGDVLDYVSETYGLATVDELARQVGLDVDETERQLRERLLIGTLKKNVTGDRTPDAVVEPFSPDDGDPQAMLESYALYIRSLVGDEWDDEAAGWRDPNGTFAREFADMPFDGATASYDMAQRAYDAVRRRNEEIQQSVDGAWSDYVNEMFRETTITFVGTAGR